MTKARIALLGAIALALAAGAAYGARGGLKRYAEPFDAPEFRVQDLSGGSHSLEAYAGKVFIVTFWATWCRPCVKELPSLQNAWEQLEPEDVRLLAINYGEAREDVEAFLQGVSTTFPIALDPDNELSEAFWVSGLPTSYVVDRSGKVVMRIVGDFEWDAPHWIQELRELNAG